MADEVKWDNLKEALNLLGSEFTAELTNQLMTAGKDASGNLINSLSFEVLEDVKGLLLDVKAAYYLKFVDEGRAPGKYPNIGAIKEWVGQRGITMQNATEDQTAFVIARSIKENGIRPTNVIENTINIIMSTKADILKVAAREDVSILMNGVVADINKSMR
jgi:hypothetical protein